MKCLVINLDREAERLEATRALFASAGMEFERIQAIDARAMSAGELRAACPRLRFYLANARRVKPGEIGCTLSHRKAWETVAERNLPLAAVCEDDVLADMDVFKAHLASIEAMDDPSVPTVWLMNRGLPRPESPEGDWYDIRAAGRGAWFWGTYCYALNAAAAARLAELLTPMANVADSWLTFARCGVRVLAAARPCAATREWESSIQHAAKRGWRFRWVRDFYWFRYRLAFRLDLLLKSLAGKRRVRRLGRGCAK